MTPVACRKFVAYKTSSEQKCSQPKMPSILQQNLTYILFYKRLSSFFIAAFTAIKAPSK
jgi:hypothetical protein